MGSLKCGVEEARGSMDCLQSPYPTLGFVEGLEVYEMSVLRRYPWARIV